MRGKLAAAVLLSAAAVAGQVKMTTGKALQLAFPGCKIERRSITLKAAQRGEVRRLSTLR